jgi:hypothetical protein
LSLEPELRIVGEADNASRSVRPRGVADPPVRPLNRRSSVKSAIDGNEHGAAGCRVQLIVGADHSSAEVASC